MFETEKEEIINEVVERLSSKLLDDAVEKLYLMLPDIIGNLITNHIAKLRINKDFYSKHPELRNKREVVASVVEMIEGQDPTVDYEDILQKAVPEVNKRLRITKSLDFKSVSEPDRNLKGLTFDNGEL